MVLSACPDIVDCTKGGISNWRDFLATVAVVRLMLGISPSDWEEARTVIGEAEASVVVACLPQRSSTIQSAGGYLDELTRKAGAPTKCQEPRAASSEAWLPRSSWRTVHLSNQYRG
jgi:replication initiation protein RepC